MSLSADPVREHDPLVTEGKRLSGLNALITGGASGIGAAAAMIFAAEGANVIVCDLTDGSHVVTEITQRGGSAVGVQCDVADAAAVHDMAKDVLARFGPVQVLFNNAGTEQGDTPVHLADPAAVDRILAVNLQGMFHTCRYLIPDMIESGGGSIVNTASIGGLVGTALHHAYCASKGGVIAFTRALAVTYGRQGIRANVICPGPTRSGISVRLGAEWEKERAAALPLGRMAEPEEIAASALYLASAEASFVTGAVLAVDGGRTAG
jgi:NAD(P)-dependent dehydrogenase (short-subunit alcohol dehydrogenase family)